MSVQKTHFELTGGTEFGFLERLAQKGFQLTMTGTYNLCARRKFEQLSESFHTEHKCKTSRNRPQKTVSFNMCCVCTKRELKKQVKRKNVCFFNSVFKELQFLRLTIEPAYSLL